MELQLASCFVRSDVRGETVFTSLLTTRSILNGLFPRFGTNSLYSCLGELSFVTPRSCKHIKTGMPGFISLESSLKYFRARHGQLQSILALRAF